MGSLGASAAMPATSSLALRTPSDVEQKLNDAATLGAVADVLNGLKAMLEARFIGLAYQRTAALWQDDPESAAASDVDSHQQLQPILEALQKAAVHYLVEIEGEALGLILRAYAKLGHAAVSKQHLLDVISKEAIHRLNACTIDCEPLMQLGAQALSNMVYAYAVLGFHPGTELLSAIAKAVQSQLRDFSPQVLILEAGWIFACVVDGNMQAQRWWSKWSLSNHQAHSNPRPCY